MANVHHATKKAADKDLSEGNITEQSRAAVLAEEMTLQEARNIGTDPAPANTPGGAAVQDEATGTPPSASVEGSTDAPPQPMSRISEDDRTRLCMCGCGRTTRGWFAVGHDVRLVTYAKEHVRGERELTDEQLEYVTTSGKLDRAKAQVEKEKHREAERAAKRGGAK